MDICNDLTCWLYNRCVSTDFFNILTSFPLGQMDHVEVPGLNLQGISIVFSIVSSLIPISTNPCYTVSCSSDVFVFLFGRPIVIGVEALSHCYSNL